MQQEPLIPRDPHHTETENTLEFQRGRLQRRLAGWLVGTAVCALGWGWGSEGLRQVWAVLGLIGLVGLIFQTGRLVQTKAILQWWNIFGFRRGHSAMHGSSSESDTELSAEGDAPVRRGQSQARVFVSPEEAVQFGWVFEDRIGAFGNAPLHRHAHVVAANGSAATGAGGAEEVFEYVGLIAHENSIPMQYMRPDFRIFGRLVYHRKSAEGHAVLLGSPAAAQS